MEKLPDLIEAVEGLLQTVEVMRKTVPQDILVQALYMVETGRQPEQLRKNSRKYIV